ncbi:MAG TPA: ABC transporter substrate-binding protein [Xanthobacteraceae bacterium]|nr:ABC transporter substrate-binding protein [Xanthobacteraceae bacterium]
MMAKRIGTLRLKALPLAAAVTMASMIAAPALAAKRDNSLRVASYQQADIIDPYFNTSLVTTILAHQIWDTLVYRDPKTGEFKGALAASWTRLDDRTIEFKLRQGVKFHDGTAFEADDVVAMLNFVAKPENKVIRRAETGWIDHAEKVDSDTVRLITKQPFPPVFELLATNIFIYPHAYYAKAGPVGMSENPVGTGPFRVTEHARGKFIRMERNPDYFKDSPKSQPRVAKLELRFIPDQQTQLAEVLAGGLDLTWDVPPEQAAPARAMPNLKVVPGETERIAFLHINGGDSTPAPPLRDVRVRQAIMYAIDREAMLKSLVGEGGRLLHTMCHPVMFGCTDAGAPRYAYDPAKAKQLLAEAGYPNGFELEFYAYRDRAQTEAMITYLRAVGIRANLRFMQPAAAREARRAGKVAMDHWTWGTGIHDVYATDAVFFGGNPDDMNRDSEVRDLLARGDTSLDPDIRKAAYAKALALIEERAYALPLFALPISFIANKDLEFMVYPDEIPRFWEMSWK